jgi:protein-disulfide isomerase
MNSTRITIIITLIVLSLLVQTGCRNSNNGKEGQKLDFPVMQADGDVVLGSDSAPKTIFMYASYHCDYCRYFFSRTYPELKSNYLDKGKVKLLVKWVDFTENEQIMRSLQAASCISKFGVFEKFHQLLLVNPAVVFTPEFDQLLDEIMQDNSEIAECILHNNGYAWLRSNVSEFRKNKLTGTPTFVLNNRSYSGFISYANFEKLLEKEFKLNKE